MKSPFKSFAAGLVTATGLAISAVSGHAQSATATISGILNAGVYDYTITLHNTGGTVLDSFWYAWTDLGNNLAVPITSGSAASSLGWVNSSIEGDTSISWAGTAGNALASGGTATFTFTSTETPAAITTSPSGGSVAYVGGIDFSQGSAGDSTSAFSPTLQTVPEPSSIGLVAAGLFGLLFRAVRKK
jgi:hypothetical protein